MNEPESNLLYYVLSFFGGGGFFILLAFLALKNLDKVGRLIAWIYSKLSWIHKSLEYGRAATEAQAAINTASIAINKQANNVLPHAMKIEWARNAQDVETYLRNGEIIVKMGYSKDRDRNLVISTLAYIEKDLIPSARPYVDKTLMKATGFTATKEILTLAKRDTAALFFLQNCLEPETHTDTQLLGDCDLLDKMNEFGYFSRIFLTQLELLGKKLFPSTPTPVVKLESRAFAEFLRTIVSREKGELIDLDFAHPRIRVKVMLIAREQTKVWGTVAYERRMKKARADGIEYVYICALGSANIRLAETVAMEEVRSGRLAIISNKRYVRSFTEGPKAEAICIVAALNLKKSAEDELEAPGVLSKLLEEHVDELRDGKVEVVAVARQPGLLSKIAVRALVNDLDATSCFRDKLKSGPLKIALGNETINVIEWNDNPASMVVSALIPLKKEDIVKLKLNKAEKIATVVISRNAPISKVIGRKGINIRTAAKLTGWDIEVKRKDDNEIE